jgi:ABC-2 type transport system ATP-binding protein
MQAKLALLLAMAYRPELLILDEPTAGLDVVVRRDFLEGVIELIQTEGRTVFFSSHIVHEVERVADWVGIIDAGKLIHCSTLDDLKAQVKQMVLAFDTMPASFNCIPSVLSIEIDGRQAAVTVQDYGEATLSAAKSLHPSEIRVDDLSLEDIFVAMVGGSEG